MPGKPAERRGSIVLEDLLRKEASGMQIIIRSYLESRDTVAA